MVTFKFFFRVVVIVWLLFCSSSVPFGLYPFPEDDLLQKVVHSLCALPCPYALASPNPLPSKPTSTDAGLTEGQTYASEVLAYLLRITLGIAGDPRYRDQWRQRGLDEPLDFKNVVETMSDPNRNSLELMVFDPTILDLTTVLYHYDKGLSLYEGDYNVTSIFPASEFIAIRLLLLQKIHRRKPVCLSALVTRQHLLQDPDVRPTQADLRAMNLTSEEWSFLRETVQSKPHLFQYLKSPFLVEALYGVGAIQLDEFAEEKISQANYRPFPCRHLQGSQRPDAVKICLIPSMTDEFVRRPPASPQIPGGFQSSDFFIQMVRKMAKDIETATKQCVEKDISPAVTTSSATQDDWSQRVWPNLSSTYLGFYVADQRPYALYPENAARAVEDICPGADFAVIILGRNVYKSIFFDPETDIYPAVNRIYVDITDIRRSQTEESARSVGCFASGRITERLLAGGMGYPTP